MTPEETAVDKLLNEDKQDPSKAVDNLLSEDKGSGALSVASQLGSKTAPDVAASVLSKGKKTGLPYDLIEKSPEILKDPPYDNRKMVDEAPVTAKYMSQSPWHASALSKDAEAYKNFEKTATLWQNTKDVVTSAINSTDQLISGIREIQSTVMPWTRRGNEMMNAVDKAAVAPSKAERIGWEQVGELAATGDIKATVSAVISNIAKAAPVIAAASTGTGGFAVVSAGGAGQEKMAAKAKGASEGQANVDASLNFLGSMFVGRLTTIPAVQGIGKEIVEKAGQSTAMAVGRALIDNMVKSGALMFTGGYAQEVSDSFARYFSRVDENAMNVDDYTDIHGKIQPGLHSRAMTQAAGGGITGLFVGAAHGIAVSPEMVTKAKENQAKSKATTNAEVFSELMRNSEASGLSKSHPDVHEDAIRSVLKEKGLDKSYIPYEHFKQYAESVGVTPEQAANELGLKLGQPGTDIEADTASLISKLSNSEHGQQFKNFVKFNPEDNVAQDFKKPIEEKEKTPIEKMQEGISKIAEKMGLKEPEPKPVKPENMAGEESSVVNEGLKKLSPAVGATEETNKMFGMSQSESDKITKAIKDVQEQAKRHVIDAEIEKQEKMQSSEMKARKKDIIRDISDEYFSRPDVAARIDLKQKFKSITGEDETLLNTKPGFTEYASYVAEKNGYDSIDHMLKSIDLSKTDEHDQAELSKIADQHLEEIYGTKPEQDQKMLDDIYYNQKLKKILTTQAEFFASDHFAKHNKIIKKIIKPSSDEKITQQAEDHLMNTTVKSISSKAAENNTQKYMYSSAEKLGKGMFEAASIDNDYARLNRELREQSRKAEDFKAEIEHISKQTSKTTTRDRLIKAGGDHLAQIDSLKALYGLPGTTRTPQEPRITLEKYVKNQKDAGNPIELPDSIKNRQDPVDYNDIPYKEFQDVGNLLSWMKNTAEREGKIDKRGKLIEIQNVVDSVKAESMLKHPNKFRDGIPIQPLQGEGSGQVDAYLKSHISPTFLLDKLGGNELQSEWYKSIYGDHVEPAQIKSSDLHKLENEFNAKLFKDLGITPREYDGWQIGKKFYKSLAGGEKISGNLTDEQLMSIFANCGSESGLRAVTKFYNWSEGDLKSAFKQGLTKKMADFIVERTKNLERYHDLMDETAKDVKGYRPKKIVGQPFEIETSDGHKVTLSGYWPLEPANGEFRNDERINEKNDIDGLFVNPDERPPKTNQDHFKRRDKAGTYPIEFKFSAYRNYTADIIHDASYRKAVINLVKIFNNDEIKSMVNSILGTNANKIFHNWIEDMAKRSSSVNTTSIDRFVNPVIERGTKAMLGWNLGPALEHMISLSGAVHEIGPRVLKAHGTLLPAAIHQSWKSVYNSVGSTEIGKGITDFFKDPNLIDDKLDFIMKSDPYMKNELSQGSSEKEINELLQRDKDALSRHLNYGTMGITGFADRHAFDFLRMMDMANKAVIWQSAYEKAMNGGFKNVEKGNHEQSVDLARQMVKQLKGSSYREDLPQILRNGGLVKSLTMFMRPMSLSMNQMVRAGSKTVELASDNKWKAARYGASAAAFLVIAPSIYRQVLHGHGPEDTDDAGSVAKWAAANSVLYPLESLVVLRAVADLIRTKSLEGKSIAEMQFSPLGHIGGTAYTGITDLIGQLNDHAPNNHKAEIEGAGFLMGLSSPAAYKLTTKLLDYME